MTGTASGSCGGRVRAGTCSISIPFAPKMRRHGRWRRNGDRCAPTHGVKQDPERIVRLVAEAYGLPMTALRQRLRNTPARPTAAYLLCKQAGMSQREAARRLGYGTGAAVSVQLNRLREALHNNAATGALLLRLERRLATTEALS